MTTDEELAAKIADVIRSEAALLVEEHERRYHSPGTDVPNAPSLHMMRRLESVIGGSEDVSQDLARFVHEVLNEELKSRRRAA